jgi:hypothetical protein
MANILADALGSAAAAVNPVSAIADLGRDLIDKFIPDPEKKAAAQLAILDKQNQMNLAVIDQQDARFFLLHHDRALCLELCRLPLLFSDAGGSAHQHARDVRDDHAGLCRDPGRHRDGQAGGRDERRFKCQTPGRSHHGRQ